MGRSKQQFGVFMIKNIKVITVGLMLLLSSLHADTLFFGMNDTFSGTSPSGSTPWITASFNQINSNTVSLTMSVANLVNSEFVTEWDFNLNPNKNPVSLSFARTDATTVGSSVATGTNAFKADGDGFYDISFTFPTANSNRFSAGTGPVSYNISSTNPLSAADFNFLSAPGGGAGPFLSAAHIQGIGADSLSGWIDPTVAVPEPYTYLVLASFLLLALSLYRIRDRVSNCS